MTNSPLITSLTIISDLYGYQLTSGQLSDLASLSVAPQNQRFAQIQKIISGNPPSPFVQLISNLLDLPLPHQIPIAQFLHQATSVTAYPLSEQDPEKVTIITSSFAQLTPSLPPSVTLLSPLIPRLLLADPSSTLSALIDLIYTFNNP